MPPEPPDGTRLEFEFWTDIYAVWRDDDSSRRAGWPTGAGGRTWCIYGQSVPMTWAELWEMFGEALLTAVRLVPHPDDIHNYDRWPTSVRAQQEGEGDAQPVQEG